MNTRHDDWARTTVRALLRRLAQRASTELQGEALRAFAAAQRCRKWR